MCKEYSANAGKMSEYERETIKGVIDSKVQESFAYIADHALGEWQGAIAKFQAAGAGFDEAYKEEIRRWEPRKFRDELDNALSLVTLAAQGTNDAFIPSDPGGKLTAIYQEAKASGDIHRQRAVYEVLRSTDLDSLPKAERPAALHLKNQAEKDLAALRVTDGMVKAREGQAAAWNDLQKAGDTLADVSKTLGQGDPRGVFASGPFARALKQVQVKSGEVVIYPIDSPEATGVVILPDLKDYAV